MSIKIGTYKNYSGLYVRLRADETKNYVILKVLNSKISVTNYNYIDKGINYIEDYKYDYITGASNPIWRIYKTLITNLNNPYRFVSYGNAMFCLLELLLNEKYRNIIFNFKKKYKYTKDDFIINKIKQIQNINID